MTGSFETNLFIAMEMDLKFSNQIIVWGKFTAPKHLKDQDEDAIAYVLAPKVLILAMAQGGKNRILDANYVTTDLEGKVNPCKLSYTNERHS